MPVRQTTAKTPLQAIRRNAGYTQAQLAYLVGIKERQVRRLEAGECKPSLATAQAISKVLKTAVDDLFEEGNTVKTALMAKGVSADFAAAAMDYFGEDGVQAKLDNDYDFADNCIYYPDVRDCEDLSEAFVADPVQGLGGTVALDESTQPFIDRDAMQKEADALGVDVDGLDPNDYFDHEGYGAYLCDYQDGKFSERGYFGAVR